jgi:hypothetical protein
MPPSQTSSGVCVARGSATEAASALFSKRNAARATSSKDASTPPGSHPSCMSFEAILCPVSKPGCSIISKSSGLSRRKDLRRRSKSPTPLTLIVHFPSSGTNPAMELAPRPPPTPELGAPDLLVLPKIANSARPAPPKAAQRSPQLPHSAPRYTRRCGHYHCPGSGRPRAGVPSSGAYFRTSCCGTSRRPTSLEVAPPPDSSPPSIRPAPLQGPAGRASHLVVRARLRGPTWRESRPATAGTLLASWAFGTTHPSSG